jgi:hypothetical protein
MGAANLAVAAVDATVAGSLLRGTLKLPAVTDRLGVAEQAHGQRCSMHGLSTIGAHRLAVGSAPLAQLLHSGHLGIVSQPFGRPINASTNRGLSTIPDGPSVEIVGSWWEAVPS